jgi:hypothetical protein
MEPVTGKKPAPVPSADFAERYPVERKAHILPPSAKKGPASANPDISGRPPRFLTGMQNIELRKDIMIKRITVAIFNCFIYQRG